MKTVLIVLAAFLVAAVALGIYLYNRLRKKEARLKEVMSHPALQDLLPEQLSGAAIDQYLYDRCCKYMMERRPFLVDKYSLQDLANALFTNRAYLSKVINKFSGRNFCSYVNYYRVMYSVEIFRANMSMKVTDMAELSGFHSATAFYQAFRSVMGEPPSHWCSRVRKTVRRKNSKL
ncbi:MAG: helix-turn-helix domain-containing protein [Bacteroidales bacterium]|jgi:AraC-like DNA-binding protein|nr:helix-turn-helix domain-containing protein [Bacteroidales bacterium]MBP5676026.1 helix-turn-helix domain-containing protein [Bacteroidales bacterium]